MKLTKQIRDEVIDKLCVSKFSKQAAELNTELQKLVTYIVDNRYTPTIRKWIKEAPKGGLTSRSSFYVYVDQIKMYRLSNDGQMYYGPTSVQAVKVLAEDANDSRLYVKSSSIVGKHLLTLLQKQKAVQTERDEFHKTIRLAIYDCLTSQGVEKKYPDLAKYLPPESRSKGLTVTNDDVRKVLGIK